MYRILHNGISSCGSPIQKLFDLTCAIDLAIHDVLLTGQTFWMLRTARSSAITCHTYIALYGYCRLLSRSGKLISLNIVILLYSLLKHRTRWQCQCLLHQMIGFSKLCKGGRLGIKSWHNIMQYKKFGQSGGKDVQED